MKITVGHAKNDSAELTIGIVLNIFGGIFIGSIYGSPFWRLTLLGAISFTVAGIILEVRILAKDSSRHYNARDNQGKRLDLNITPEFMEAFKSISLSANFRYQCLQLLTQIDASLTQVAEDSSRVRSQTK